MACPGYPRLAVFDLDGTLLDTAPGICAAVNRQLAGHGLAPLDLAAVTAMIGDGAAALCERAFAARGRPVPPGVVAGFSADPDVAGSPRTRLFPGVDAMLDGLLAGGWRLAVCTNKPAAPARAVLAHVGVAAAFHAIGGGDSFAARKPDPGHLLATLALAGGVPGRAVMIGDHRNDIAAARGAGLRCIFAGWGYGTPIMAVGATAVAATPSALPALLNGLLPE